MSDGPTSAPDAPLLGASLLDEGLDPRALLAAGWRLEELEWERLQERACEDAAAKRFDVADALFAQALKLARATFANNDPRLATSLANQAVALRRRGAADGGRSLFDEALAIWDAAGPWIEALKEDRKARSATYHLRLESRYKGGYVHFWKERYRARAAEGRDALVALCEEGSREESGLDLWRKDKPAGFNDARKLLAAVRLLARQ